MSKQILIIYHIRKSNRSTELASFIRQHSSNLNNKFKFEFKCVTPALHQRFYTKGITNFPVMVTPNRRSCVGLENIINFLRQVLSNINRSKIISDESYKGTSYNDIAHEEMSMSNYHKDKGNDNDDTDILDTRIIQKRVAGFERKRSTKTPNKPTNNQNNQNNQNNYTYMDDDSFISDIGDNDIYKGNNDNMGNYADGEVELDDYMRSIADDFQGF